MVAGVAAAEPDSKVVMKRVLWAVERDTILLPCHSRRCLTKALAHGAGAEHTFNETYFVLSLRDLSYWQLCYSSNGRCNQMRGSASHNTKHLGTALRNQFGEVLLCILKTRKKLAKKS